MTGTSDTGDTGGTTEPTRAKVTAPDLRALKGQRRIVMVTAYDYPSAVLSDAAGVDSILVGDSLGMVVLGYESTVPVTMAEMLHHGRAVVRGARSALVVVDLPFMAYQVSNEQAVRNAGRLMKETGCDAVKLEGGEAMAPRVRAIVQAGIPVVAHVGLTPQTASALGGLRVQGRDVASARAILAGALAVEAAGAFAVVLEAIPRQLATLITARVTIPTIGIGAGADCDGQVLVNADMLGLYPRSSPKFSKQYADLGSQYRAALERYAAEVRAGTFPAAEHTFTLRATVLREIASDG
ncbi:MAG: 3-methyl-2-oxobutanoate hydroxymethyltransferase [Thermomicrobiales bacterium]